MALQATALGLASCIVARGEDTFENETGKRFLQEWGVPENYIARCFVILGHIAVASPAPKPRKPGRRKIVE